MMGGSRARRRASLVVLAGVAALTAGLLVPVGAAGAEGEDEVPAEVMAELDTAWTAAENDAATQFTISFLLKIAELQNRFRPQTNPGDQISQGILDQIEAELRDFLGQYDQALCEKELVVPGITEKINFPWWSAIPPLLWFRIGACKERLANEAVRLLQPCSIAGGWWGQTYTSMRGRTFANYSEAQRDGAEHLMGQGVPYAMAMQIATVTTTYWCQRQ
jgi:hypothetical protein